MSVDVLSLVVARQQARLSALHFSSLDVTGTNMTTDRCNASERTSVVTGMHLTINMSEMFPLQLTSCETRQIVAV